MPRRRARVALRSSPESVRTTGGMPPIGAAASGEVVPESGIGSVSATPPFHGSDEPCALVQDEPDLASSVGIGRAGNPWRGAGGLWRRIQQPCAGTGTQSLPSVGAGVQHEPVFRDL